MGSGLLPAETGGPPGAGSGIVVGRGMAEGAGRVGPSRVGAGRVGAGRVGPSRVGAGRVGPSRLLGGSTRIAGDKGEGQAGVGKIHVQDSVLLSWQVSMPND